jgi:hypothetical protein
VSEQPPHDREAAGLRDFLTDHDAECPCCHYNLRGLQGEHCPECNQRLVLRVGLAEPPVRTYLAAVMALALGAGFFGLGSLLIVGVSIYLSDWPPRRQSWPIYLGGAVFSPALAALLACRTRFYRLDAARRRGAVRALWLLLVAWIAMMIYVMVV